MVLLTHLLLPLATIAGSLAAPTDPTALYTRDLEQRAPDFEVHNASSLFKRQDYNQNYKTGGNVNFSPRSNGYSVTFSGAADFVVGKGWSTGSTRNINFSGTWTATAGTVMLTVYGWTKNPLVEYYIMEDYTSYQGGGTKKGEVTSDGSTYTIYQHTQVNQPSIVGTSTFSQYISVRQSKRTSGTVTTANHFNAWAKVGLNLGSHSYQVVATEGWGNAAGSTNMTIT